MDKFIGIDLGTTNSCISFYRKVDGADNGQPNIVKLHGKSTIPSCVMYKDGEFIVGKEAYDNRAYPSTIYSVKRLMGTNSQIAVTDASTGEVITLTPTEVSAKILAHIKKEAEKVLGVITELTITVPAYFTPNQKKDTLEAGYLAGFKYITIINEPTSAALAYQLEATKSIDGLIFDLGGGTFDISVVKIDPILEQDHNVNNENGDDPFLTDFYGIASEDLAVSHATGTVVKVLESDGDNKLGGDDIDQAILRRIIFEESQVGRDLSFLAEGGVLREEMLLKIEEFKKLNMAGKITLSNGEVIVIRDSHIEFGVNKVMNKCMRLTMPLVEKYKDSLESIILVGGSTKSPHVISYLQKSLGDLNIRIHSDLNPDEAVGLGASVNSAVRNSDITGIKLYDVLADTISVEVEDGKLEPIVTKGSLLPAIGHKDVTLLEGNTVANIKVYMGSGYTDDETSHYLGYVQLNADSENKGIRLEMSVDLDSILHLKAVSATSSVEKELIDVSNLSKKPKKIKTQDSVEDRLSLKRNTRRIANTRKILNEAREIPSVFSSEYLDRISSLLTEYKQADNMDNFYHENKKELMQFTRKYADYLENITTDRSDRIKGTILSSTQSDAEYYNTSDDDDENSLSNRFQ